MRVLALGAPSLLKLLELREQRTLARIYGEFKNGKLEQLGNLAEFCAIRDQLTDIKSALKQFERTEDKRHANADTNADEHAGTNR